MELIEISLKACFATLPCAPKNFIEKTYLRVIMPLRHYGLGNLFDRILRMVNGLPKKLIRLAV